MRILLWNIMQGGGTRKSKILERIKAHDPDVVVLLEFIEKTAGVFLQRMWDSGWTYRLSTKPDGFNHHIGVLSKRAIVSKASGISVLDDSGLWLEACFANYDLSLGVVHVPSYPRASKMSYLNGLIEVASRRKNASFLFMGDFNTGRHPIDGDVLPLGGVDRFTALQEAGFTDAWRHFHRTKAEYSYYMQAKGFRIDHVLASELALARVSECFYSHREREEGVSDHSILLVELNG